MTSWKKVAGMWFVFLVGLFLSQVAISDHGYAQTARYNRKNIADIMGFEAVGSDNVPTGWSGNPPGTVVADNKVVHSGRWAVRLDRRQAAAGSFSALTTAIPMDFGGNTVELRGWIKTENVAGFAGLWLREDAHGNAVEFSNMQQQNLHGTHDWQSFTVRLPLNDGGDRLVFGALLSGTGVVWVDDLELRVDGKPVAEAPPPTPLLPSGVSITKLTRMQIENLSVLARVWGFLKYHDPVVTAGKRNWDADLFRIIPQTLTARSQADANASIVRWIDSLGPIETCTRCATLDTAALTLRPDIEWIHDRKLLGLPLSRRLESVYANRVPNQQYYVALAPNVNNPVFQHENSYGALQFPDAGYQLLGLFRLWNIVEYWAPNRELASENWAEVLPDFIPQFVQAANRNAYALVMMRFIAEIHDTHANLWSSLALRPPVGSCRLPVDVRFIGPEAVVTAYTSEKGAASGLQRGDVLIAIDGKLVSQEIHDWTPYYADSNEAARLRDVGRVLTNGECGPVPMTVRREGELTSLTSTRMDMAQAGQAAQHEDLTGPTFRLLSPEIAYLKLSSVKAADVPKYIEQAKGTRGLIVDLRNYPSDFVVFALGSLLVNRPTPFAEFSIADLSNPGAFRIGDIESLKPAQPHYNGKVVVLVNAVTQSQAEYTTMALQASPETVVIGSTTAGADGNVSPILLPGGLSTMISGLGVFYPDGTSAQCVGVRVNVPAQPTVTGVAAGHDELLETAIRQIDPSLSTEAVEKIAQPVTNDVSGN
jgi:Peptidase family S41